jgi:hypothetical protein
MFATLKVLKVNDLKERSLLTDDAVIHIPQIRL